MSDKQQTADDYAIEFAKWMAKEYWLNSSGKYTQGQTYKELLETFKKEIIMSDKKVTPVQWFEQQLDNLDIEIPFSVFEEAKEIEKQQIIDAVTFGQNNHTIKVSVDLEIAQEYFKQKFVN
jgi:hypothetical protein